MNPLQQRYWGSFVLCGLVCALFQVLARGNIDGGATSRPISPKFAGFQMNYLVVFTLAMFSDWLQGPYVYELYVSYGFSQAEIAELFVCGFASSMLVGTFVGGLADKCGRKIMCVIYSITYITACFTKLVPEYWTLMLGRFLSGVSTSLLFSVFESWMVCEHNKQGFDGASLGDTFSYATFGNGLCAVIAGLVANSAAHSYGYVAPFCVAILPLVLCAAIVSSTWTENYGEHGANSTLLSSLSKGFELIRKDSKIAALGLSQSCFEGAMYTFVFMWTPALKSAEELEAEAKNEPLPVSTAQFLGLIFAVFMVCVMVGSSIYKIAANDRANVYKIPIILHTVALLSTLTTTVLYESKIIVYVCFLIFETSVGVFYPAYGVIKSEKIPEEIRSSVMNIFRMPLNAFVVLLLLKIKYLSPHFVFGICTLAHTIALTSYYYFYSSIQKTDFSSGLNTAGKKTPQRVTGEDKDDIDLARDPEIQREIQRAMNRKHKDQMV